MKVNTLERNNVMEVVNNVFDSFRKEKKSKIQERMTERAEVGEWNGGLVLGDDVYKNV